MQEEQASALAHGQATGAKIDAGVRPLSQQPLARRKKPQQRGGGVLLPARHSKPFGGLEKQTSTINQGVSIAHLLLKRLAKSRQPTKMMV